MLSSETQAGFTPSSYSYTQSDSSISDAIAYHTSNPYNPSPDSPDGWGYPHTAPQASLRNVQRTGMPAPTPNEPWNTHATYRPDTEAAAFRTWPGADPAYQATVYNNHQDLDRSYHPVAQPDGREYPQWNHSQQESYAPNFDTSASALYGAPAYPQQSPQTPYYPANYAQSNTSSSSSPPSGGGHPLPRHIYTRTLVGPLSSNACRLLDENQVPGIFFLFQDLSVRTEGSRNSISRQFLPLKVCSKYTSRDLSSAATANERWRVRLFASVWGIPWLCR